MTMSLPPPLRQPLCLIVISAAIALIASGCFLDFGAAIPCEADQDCAEGYVCNYAVSRCVPGHTDDDDLDDAGGGEGEEDGSSAGDTDTSDGDDDIDSGDAEDAKDDILDCIPGEPGCDILPCDPELDEDCVLDDPDVEEPPACDVERDPGCDVEQGACPAGMAQVRKNDVESFCIDIFEASRTDATDTAGGVSTSQALSRPGVLPWTGVEYQDAEAACLAADKRLCTEDEWERACRGSSNNVYPYPGNKVDREKCVGFGFQLNPTDPLARNPLPTATATECRTEAGIYDMSGNVSEWVQRKRVRGGHYGSQSEELRCRTERDPARQNVPADGTGFRCCANYPL